MSSLATIYGLTLGLGMAAGAAGLTIGNKLDPIAQPIAGDLTQEVPSGFTPPDVGVESLPLDENPAPPEVMTGGGREIYRRLRQLVPDEEQVSAIVDFLKTPVTDWQMIADSVSGVNRRFKLAQTSKGSMPNALVQIMKLIYLKFTQMKAYAEGDHAKKFGDFTEKALEVLRQKGGQQIGMPPWTPEYQQGGPSPAVMTKGAIPTLDVKAMTLKQLQIAFQEKNKTYALKQQELNKAKKEQDELQIRYATATSELGVVKGEIETLLAEKKLYQDRLNSITRPKSNEQKVNEEVDKQINERYKEEKGDDKWKNKGEKQVKQEMRGDDQTKAFRAEQRDKFAEATEITPEVEKQMESLKDKITAKNRAIAEKEAEKLRKQDKADEQAATSRTEQGQFVSNKLKLKKEEVEKLEKEIKTLATERAEILKRIEIESGRGWFGQLPKEQGIAIPSDLEARSKKYAQASAAYDAALTNYQDASYQQEVARSLEKEKGTLNPEDNIPEDIKQRQEITKKALNEALSAKQAALRELEAPVGKTYGTKFSEDIRRRFGFKSNLKYDELTKSPYGLYFIVRNLGNNLYSELQGLQGLFGVSNPSAKTGGADFILWTLVKKTDDTASPPVQWKVKAVEKDGYTIETLIKPSTTEKVSQTQIDFYPTTFKTGDFVKLKSETGPNPTKYKVVRAKTTKDNKIEFELKKKKDKDTVFKSEDELEVYPTTIDPATTPAPPPTTTAPTKTRDEWNKKVAEIEGKMKELVTKKSTIPATIDEQVTKAQEIEDLQDTIAEGWKELEELYTKLPKADQEKITKQVYTAKEFYDNELKRLIDLGVADDINSFQQSTKYTSINRQANIIQAFSEKTLNEKELADKTKRDADALAKTSAKRNENEIRKRLAPVLSDQKDYEVKYASFIASAEQRLQEQETADRQRQLAEMLKQLKDKNVEITAILELLKPKIDLQSAAFSEENPEMDVTGNAAARRKDIEEWIRNNARFTGGAYFSNKTQLLTDSNPTLFEKGRINTWKRVVIRDPNQASLITILLAISKEFRQLPLSRQESVARQFRKQYMASSIPVLKEEDRKRVADDTQPIADGDFKFLLKYLELNVLAVQVVLDQSTNLYDETFKVVSSDPANPNVLDVEYEPNPKYENNDAITVLAVREPTTDPNNRGIYYYPIFQDYFFKPSMILTANEIKIIKKDFEDQTKTPGVVWKTIKVVGDTFKTAAVATAKAAEATAKAVGKKAKEFQKSLYEKWKPYGWLQTQDKNIKKLKQTAEAILQQEKYFAIASRILAEQYQLLKEKIDTVDASTLQTILSSIENALQDMSKSTSNIQKLWEKQQDTVRVLEKDQKNTPPNFSPDTVKVIQDTIELAKSLMKDVENKQEELQEAVQKQEKLLKNIRNLKKQFGVAQRIPGEFKNLVQGVIPNAFRNATRITKETIVQGLIGKKYTLFVVTTPITIPITLASVAFVQTEIIGLQAVAQGLGISLYLLGKALVELQNGLKKIFQGTDTADIIRQLKELYPDLVVDAPPPPPPEPSPPPPPEPEPSPPPSTNPFKTINEIEADIQLKHPDINTVAGDTIVKDTYGTPLNNADFESVQTSGNKNDCLIHSFLIDVSPSFRKLSNDQRDSYADFFRRTVLPTKYTEAEKKVNPADDFDLINTERFLTDIHVVKLARTFEINILLFERIGGTDVLSNHICCDLFKDKPFIVIYNPGDLHFRGVKRKSDGSYILSNADGEAMTTKYAASSARPPPGPSDQSCETIVRLALKGKTSLTYDNYKEVLEDAKSVGYTSAEVDECLTRNSIPIPTAPSSTTSEGMIRGSLTVLSKIAEKILQLSVDYPGVIDGQIDATLKVQKNSIASLKTMKNQTMIIKKQVDTKQYLENSQNTLKKLIEDATGSTPAEPTPELVAPPPSSPVKEPIIPPYYPIKTTLPSPLDTINSPILKQLLESSNLLRQSKSSRSVLEKYKAQNPDAQKVIDGLFKYDQDISDSLIDYEKQTALNNDKILQIKASSKSDATKSVETGLIQGRNESLTLKIRKYLGNIDQDFPYVVDLLKHFYPTEYLLRKLQIHIRNYRENFNLPLATPSVQKAIEWQNSLTDTLKITNPNELDSKQKETEVILFNFMKQALYEKLSARFYEFRLLLGFYKIDQSVYQDLMKNTAMKQLNGIKSAKSENELMVAVDTDPVIPDNIQTTLKQQIQTVTNEKLKFADMSKSPDAFNEIKSALEVLDAVEGFEALTQKMIDIKDALKQLSKVGSGRKTYRQQHRLPSIAKRLRTFRR